MDRATWVCLRVDGGVIVVGAKDAFEEALKVEPTNVQAKSGLKAVEDAIAREAEEDGATPDLGLGKVPPNPLFSHLLLTTDVQRSQPASQNCRESQHKTSFSRPKFHAKTPNGAI
jgi:stress-induced-phosphoprotein 1